MILINPVCDMQILGFIEQIYFIGAHLWPIKRLAERSQLYENVTLSRPLQKMQEVSAGLLTERSIPGAS
jgi:hypothetical protein